LSIDIMEDKTLLIITRVCRFLATLVVVRTLVAVFGNLFDYFPPNFQTGFLAGREGNFWNGYHLAFYAHVITGPLSLILGPILVSDWFRRRWPAWHRALGRVQVVNVLLGVAPSGFLMALETDSGPVAAWGFAVLSIGTALCVWQGWQAAVQRQFAVHRQWMNRCFVLLLSAVVIRLIGGISEWVENTSELVYPLSAWLCWLVPLIVYELLGQPFRRMFTEAQT
jgi:uncharacterized membrane protein